MLLADDEEGGKEGREWPKREEEKEKDAEEPWWRARRIEAAFARYGHRAGPPGEGGGIPWIHPEIREAARRCKCNQEGLN